MSGRTLQPRLRKWHIVHMFPRMLNVEERGNTSRTYNESQILKHGNHHRYFYHYRYYLNPHHTSCTSRRGEAKWTSSIYETERQREGGTVCAKSSMASIAML